MNKKIKKIAFLVSGWGLGHATRVWAVIQQIRIEEPSCEVTVLTWGQSLLFFKQQAESFDFKLIPIVAYTEGHETLYTWNFFDYFSKPLKWFWIWLKNSFFLFYYFKNNRADVCVFDSDFHYLSVLFFKTKRISISQTPYVIEHWAKLKNRFPVRLKINFFIFEYLDFLIQIIFNHIVVCPRLDKSNSQSAKIVFVPPIVRSEFLLKRETAWAHHQIKLAAVGSGSVLSSLMEAVIKRHQIEYAYNSKCRYGLDENGLPVIDRYNTLFTQCGLSTLSEGASRGHKLLLYPITQSPEQMINSIVTESLNFGYRVGHDMAPIPLSIDQSLNLQAWEECNGAKKTFMILQSALVSS